jgi:uncharacterized membrane protein
MFWHRHFSAIRCSSDPRGFRSSPVRLVRLAAVGALLLRSPTTAFTWPSPAARSRQQNGLGSRTPAATWASALHCAARPASDDHYKVEDAPSGTTSNGPTSTPATRAGWSERSSFRRQGEFKPEHKAGTPARVMEGAMVLAAALFLSPLSADATEFGRQYAHAAMHIVIPSNPSTSFGDGSDDARDRGEVPSLPAAAGSPRFSASGVDSGGLLRGTSPFLVSSASAVALYFVDWALRLLFAGSMMYVMVAVVEPARLPKLLPVAETSALGRGTSVIQVTVAMHVPQRHDPKSILSVLRRMASTATTDSREGVQDLVSAVAMELLRRKSSIVSAYAASKHYKRRDHALREYGFWSARERSNFEQETITNFGGNKRAASWVLEEDGPSPRSEAKGGGGGGTTTTLAVVTLLLAIDGDVTRPRPIRSLASVEDALGKITVDATTDACLRSAEILWTPSDPSETLTTVDVMVDYPQLRPL